MPPFSFGIPSSLSRMKLKTNPKTFSFSCFIRAGSCEGKLTEILQGRILKKPKYTFNKYYV